MRKKSKQISALLITAVLTILFICISEELFCNGTVQEILGPTVVKNVRVFNGERIISKTTVVISDGRILTVKKNAQIPDKANVIDGKGLTLVPGFFDAHVHIWDKQNLKQSLIFGVTTVMDMFMDIKTMTEIKKLQSSGKANDMAYLISPGILATSPNGHGTQYGASIPTITKPEEAQAFVDARISEGSDFIKIIYDDGRTYATLRPTLNKATIAAVIKATHKRGKIAVIHAATLQNCIDALEAGVDGLAHLFFNKAFDSGFGRLAARKKVFIIPTLSVLESMSGISGAMALADDPHLSPFLKQMDVQGLKMTFPFTTEREAYEAAEKALKQLKAENVPILAGTDAPNPGTSYGASLHGELELLVKAGLTPLEALMSATSIPAAKFGLNDRGKIHPGLVADLVLVKGDPTKDIKVSRNIVGIWRNGVKVDRDKYLAEVIKEKKDLENQKTAPPPENSESGLISDFEGDKIKAIFGDGWSISTDAMMGGKSTAKYQLIEGGAQGSKGSMLITGTISAESSTPWAGAFFSPGSGMMMPANLSHKKSISFWAKGDGKTYAVMVFAQSLGYMPVSLAFVPGPEWKEFVFSFEKFGTKGHDIMGIFIGASEEPGEFTLQIDNVCFFPFTID